LQQKEELGDTDSTILNFDFLSH